MIPGIFGDYDRLMRYQESNDEWDISLVVSTIQASDTDHPYETAVSHFELNPGRWTVVEEYDSLEDAQAGHEKWIARMTGDDLPEKLEDVSTCLAKEMDKVLS